LAQLPGDDFYPAINRVFDFDAYLTFWAAATVMGYWDGYPSDPNNYRIYHNPSDDRWTLIPSGIDQVPDKNVDPFKPVGMLSVRCLAEEDCEAAFRARLMEVIDLFEKSNYPAMAREIAQQIRADVIADPRKEITVEEWQAAVDSTIEYINRRPGELRAMLTQPQREEPQREFQFNALTDPQGTRFIYVTWFAQSDEAEGGRRWFTAKGYFEGLHANMDAIELAGGSAGGEKIGTVTVDFVDCETANFQFSPDDPSQPRQNRTASIDSEIWKYCE